MRRGWRYNQVPAVRVPRSVQNLSHSVRTSMSIGYLYPIDWFETLPDDKIRLRSASVSRLTSAYIRPVMDNIYLDVYHFYIPYRILYDGYTDVLVNPNKTAYTNDEFGKFPSITGLVAEKSVGDYLGLPIGCNIQVDVNGNAVSVLPFRAFAMVVELYFRNQQTQDEIYVHTGERAPSEVMNTGPWTPNNYTGMLPPVSKKLDYFTSCLPKPQRGPEVIMPLGDELPVSFDTYPGTGRGITFSNPLRLKTSVPVPKGNTSPLGVQSSAGIFQKVVGDSGVDGLTESFDVTGWNVFATANLAAATGVPVNDFRFAVQLQKMLERDAIFGAHLKDYYHGHWNVNIRDETVQYPVYLGGSRTPLEKIQVAQTNSPAVSDATEDTPLGTLGAYSWSVGKSRFSTRCKEFGMILTVGCLRYDHSYQQGIDAKWRRFTRNQFPDPLFGTIGMQPVYQSELYADGSNWDTVFGYQEAWMPYRVIPNSITGQMRSKATDSLDVWHFGDKYVSAPVLSEAFTNETPENVDRTIAVPSTSMDTFIFDFGFNISAVRKILAYSQPGLVDHH